jgi:hypothetical protein
VNGSFESPLVTVGGFANFPGGSTAINGWTVVGVDSSVVSGTFMQGSIVFQAQDGNQWIDMAGETSNNSSSGVMQDVATTPGATYLLSFYVGSATDGVLFFAATVDLTIGSGTRTSYKNPTAPTDKLDWLKFTVPFVATNSITNIKFQNGSASNNYLAALDNVTLEEVPGSVVPEVNGLMTWLVLAACASTFVGVKRTFFRPLQAI